jgi:SHS2 domain-containing protein
MQSGTGFQEEEHVGEWKVTLHAHSLEELFVEAARVVGQTGGPMGEVPGEWEKVSLSAPSIEILLADWLNELIGRSEIHRCVYMDVRNMQISDGRLEAEIRGLPVNEWRSPIKAATYHGIVVTQEDDHWQATFVLDV